MRTRSSRTLIVAALLAWACGRTEVVRLDAEPLPVPDAGRDAGGADAGPDAGRDAGIDAGVDAGPVDGGDKPCIVGRFGLTPAVPVVGLVLDRSGSMGDPFPDGVSKWDALRGALGATLPAVDQTMQLGLLLFPVSSTQECVPFASFNVPPATGQVQRILELLDAGSPVGGTPTAAAIDMAALHLRARRTASTAKALVLATDGAPICNGNLDPRTCTCLGQPPCRSVLCLDLDETSAAIARAADAGMPTYVIGLEATSEQLFVDALNAMALAGTRPQAGAKRYYAATSRSELQRAFAAIRDQVSQCSYLTSSVPNAQGSIVVTRDGGRIPFDVTGDAGWRWTDRGNGELLIHGLDCTLANGRPGALEALVTCGP